MAFRRRSIVLTTSAGGAATGYLNLGAKFANVLAIKIGNPSDESTDYTITDADAEQILTVATLDSNPAVKFSLVDDGREASDGAAAADAAHGLVAKSPLKIVIADGGNAVAHTVDVDFEV